jgi:hypothetical protein
MNVLVICDSGVASSLTQNKSFNYKSVEAFFENLKEVMSRYNFTANRIYNLDEVGNSAFRGAKLSVLS